MQIGIVGLGRMGAGIGRRLMKHGHDVVGYDASAAAVKALEGATGATALKDLVETGRMEMSEALSQDILVTVLYEAICPVVTPQRSSDTP